MKMEGLRPKQQQHQHQQRGFSNRTMTGGVGNDPNPTTTYWSDIRLHSRQFGSAEPVQGSHPPDAPARHNHNNHKSIWNNQDSIDLHHKNQQQPQFASVRPSNLYSSKMISDSGPFGPPMVQQQGQQLPQLPQHAQQSQLPQQAQCPTSTASDQPVTMRKKKSPSKKPPLPPPPTECGSTGSMQAAAAPRPPPRTRPKSWTSSLFNAMKTTHRSVTFQCVDEDVQMVSLADKNSGNGDTSGINVASYCTLPARPSAAAAAAVGATGVKASSHSRTPSPFRSMVKGLFKGQSLPLCGMWDLLIPCDVTTQKRNWLGVQVISG